MRRKSDDYDYKEKMTITDDEEDHDHGDDKERIKSLIIKKGKLFNLLISKEALKFLVANYKDEQTLEDLFFEQVGKCQVVEKSAITSKNAESKNVPLEEDADLLLVSKKLTTQNSDGTKGRKNLLYDILDIPNPISLYDLVNPSNLFTY